MTDDRYWLFQSTADDREVEAVREVIQRGTWWASGPEVEEFEEAIAEQTDREHGITFNSGTSALFAVLRAIGISGKEVIVPSFTYPATPNAVVAAGGRPVFADIERESMALDAASVRRAITPDTTAILPVHFSGDIAAQITELRALAEEHGLTLIEDAAHSLGATLDGTPVGSFGEAAAFSFAFNKLVTTGEGGMLVTDDDGLAADVRQFRFQGRTDTNEYASWGLNLCMSSITAAIGVVQASKLEQFVNQRAEMATYMNERLEACEQLTCPTPPDDRDRVYLFYNLRLPNRESRDELRTYLDDRGIPSRVTYEPVHTTEYYRSTYGWKPEDLPVTRELSDRILTLPFHLELTHEDLENICTHVHSFFQER